MLRVCGMCVSCFGVVVCCAVSLCVVLVLVLVCNVWCVVSEVCVRVDSKRLRVCRQNARVTFDTGVLAVHTETF